MSSVLVLLRALCLIFGVWAISRVVGRRLKRRRHAQEKLDPRLDRVLRALTYVDSRFFVHEEHMQDSVRNGRDN